MAELISVAPKRCGFDGCDKRPRGRLCSGHGEQRRLGRPLTPIMPRLPLGGPCGFDSCDKTNTARGFCDGHREHLRKGQPLRPLGMRRASGASSVRDERGRKQCRDCLEWLSIEHFANHPSKGDGYKGSCRECRRINGLARKYNLSQDRYEQMLVEQGNSCAVCQVSFSRKVIPAVDHDHSCCPRKRNTSNSCGRCVRGLLCRGCNTALGNLGDDVDRLLRAAIYLAGRGEVGRRLGGLGSEERAS